MGPGDGIEGRRPPGEGGGSPRERRGEPPERRKREGERSLIVRERVRRYAASAGPLSCFGASGFGCVLAPSAFFGGEP